MAVIERVDWTDNTDISKGSFLREFNLTSWDDGTTLDLAGGRYESLNGFAYKITGGDFSVDTSPATTDGTWYIHIVEDGVTPGNAIAYLDSNAGIYRGDLGGFYYNVGGGRLAKVWGIVEKVGTSFNQRGRYSQSFEKGSSTFGDIDTNGSLSIAGPFSIDASAGNTKVTVIEYIKLTGSVPSTPGITDVPLPTNFDITNTIIDCIYVVDSNGYRHLIPNSNSTGNQDSRVTLRSDGSQRIQLLYGFSGGASYEIIVKRYS
jgi:hypothetical protein